MLRVILNKSCFIGLKLSYTSRTIMKWIAISGVRQPDIRCDVVAVIFWQPKLCSPACLKWHRVLIQDEGFSSSNSRYRAGLSPLGIWWRPPSWVCNHVGWWMKVWDHHRQWPPQTPWCGLDAYFFFIHLWLIPKHSEIFVLGLPLWIQAAQHAFLNLWRS